MNKKTLQRYADIKKTIKALEEEAKALEPVILDDLDTIGTKTLKLSYGVFSLVTRKRWTYSKELQGWEERSKVVLTSKKREEEEDGTAKYVEVKGVTFNQKHE